MRALAFVIVIAALATSVRARAQPPESALLPSDRPGFPAIVQTTPVGRAITEADVVTSFNPREPSVATPTLLARYGVLPWLELRTRLPSVVLGLPSDNRGGVRVTSDDLQIGAGFAGRIDKNLSGGIVPTLELPIGGLDGTGAQGVDAFVEAALSWTVFPGLQLQLGTNIGWVDVPRHDGQLEPRFRMSNGVTCVIQPVRTLILFAQTVVQVQDGASTAVIVGGGFEWWVVPTLFTLYLEVDAGVDAPRFTPLIDIGTAWMW